jgi:hypothetical protein
MRHEQDVHVFNAGCICKIPKLRLRMRSDYGGAIRLHHCMVDHLRTPYSCLLRSCAAPRTREIEYGRLVVADL